MTFCLGISLLHVCANCYRRIGSMNGTNSSAKHYDMVVIGSGAAGHHGAIQAAKLDRKVAVVERSIALGGGQYQHRYDSEEGTSGGCRAFYPIRVHGSPDLGLKPGAEN
jgi:heterodisulfide reductase subunit A-like polyferredoxin